MMLGGFLNLVFDPILILLFHMQVAGAAVATAVSNVVSLIYFVAVLRSPSRGGTLSLRPSDFSLAPIRPVFSVGICAALNTFLAGIGNMLIVKLAARYGDIPVAAFGIVKKIDMLPINISMGLCQGYMPLLGYNYVSGNYRRMRKISLFTWTCSIVFSLLCIAVSLGGAPVILRFFIRSPETEAMGAAFLRIACLAVPLTAINFLISYALQAIGKARAALLFSALRLGILNIPLLFLLNAAFGLYGLICAQLVTEALSILVSLAAYRREMAKLPGTSVPPNA